MNTAIKAEYDPIPPKKVLTAEEKLQYAIETTMFDDDPALWMLFDGVKTTPIVHSEKCYICCDPDYARMGLPLCRKCPNCGGHIAADDSICDNCGYDEMDEQCST